MSLEIIEKARREEELSAVDVAALLSITDRVELQALYDCAYEIKTRYVGRVAYFRGIIECSNICMKDCCYCGIRKSNSKVERFLMEEEEIFREALWAYEANYGSCVIQSGERQDATFVDMIERVLERITKATQGEMGVTLSLGEQSEETYRRWRAAGASRYLLRIETTNPELYARFHPGDHYLTVRLECLAALRRTGYQVGTGVLIGLPEQTVEDLANDVLFLKQIDIDMVGMGPYIPHAETPLGRALAPYTAKQNHAALELGLKMIAVTRIVLKDVNIASTTALQALNNTGREQGLLCGANVIMPNITETGFRPKYQLYENKPCLDENAASSRDALYARIESIGETVGFSLRGDAPHYFKRTSAKLA